MTTFAVLGLGEAGSLIATGLLAAGAVVRGYDPRGAVPAGVHPAADAAQACRAGPPRSAGPGARFPRSLFQRDTPRATTLCAPKQRSRLIHPHWTVASWRHWADPRGRTSYSETGGRRHR
jgi:hypothetical protein